jgi:hypothetical protein
MLRSCLKTFSCSSSTSYGLLDLLFHAPMVRSIIVATCLVSDSGSLWWLQCTCAVGHGVTSVLLGTVHILRSLCSLAWPASHSC